MGLNKRSIQKEVDITVATGKYTENLGQIILDISNISVLKKGLYYRYNEFEIEFIIKPRIVDMLLLKVFRYDKNVSSAYTFLSLITSSAILDAIRDVRKEQKGESRNVFYIEEIGREVANLVDCGELYNNNDVYLDGDVIKLN